MCCFLSGDGSGGGGGDQSLAEVLVVGNNTGITDIVVDAGARIQFQHEASAPAPVADTTLTWARTDGWLVMTLPDGTDNVIAPGTIARTGSVITANYTAELGEEVLINPTGGTFTVSAPATASNGGTFAVKNVSTSLTAVSLSGNGHNIEDPETFSLGSTVSLAGDGRYIAYQFSSQQNAWLKQTSRDLAVTIGEVTVYEADFTAQGSVALANGPVNITDSRGVTSAWTMANINAGTDTVSFGAATGFRILSASTTSRAYNTSSAPTCIFLSVPITTIVPNWDSVAIYRYEFHLISQALNNSTDGPIFGIASRGAGSGNTYGISFVRGANPSPDPRALVNGAAVSVGFSDTLDILLGIAAACPNSVYSVTLDRGTTQSSYGVFGTTWPTRSSMRGALSENVASTTQQTNNAFTVRGGVLVESTIELAFTNGTTGAPTRDLQIGHIRIVRMIG